MPAQGVLQQHAERHAMLSGAPLRGLEERFRKRDGGPHHIQNSASDAGASADDAIHITPYSTSANPRFRCRKNSPPTTNTAAEYADSTANSRQVGQRADSRRSRY